MKLSGSGVFAIAATIVVGIIAYTLWQKKGSITAAAGAVGTALNPVSDQNLAYKAANAVTQALTGDSGATLGTKLWELVNPGQAASDNAITAPTGPNVPTSKSLIDVFSTAVQGDTLADIGTLGLRPPHAPPGGLDETGFVNKDDPLAYGYVFPSAASLQ